MFTAKIRIFDRQQRDREAMLLAAEQKKIRPLIFNTSSTLKYHAEEILELTASHRDFRQSSAYDRALQGIGHRHLNFLDREGILKIFRGLKLYHSPNLYQWQVCREGALTDAEVDPVSGEVIFAEDRKVKYEFEELKLLQDQKRKVKEKIVLHRSGVIRKPENSYDSLFRRSAVEKVREPKQNYQNRFNQPMRCRICGEMTYDWVQMFPKDGSCFCRGCNKKRFPKGSELKNAE